VCDARSSTRDLLLLAYGLTINGYFLSERWNPYGDPPPLDPRIGTPGETILPEQRVDPTVIAPSSFGGEPRPTISAPARSAAATVTTPTRPFPSEPLNDPLPGAAVVPRPQATDLSEPAVERSNLPQRAPRPVQRLNVPSPDAPAATVPQPGADVPPPPPGAARTVSPTTRNATGPSVRVIELSSN
jgi:hypothetical protein